MEIVLRNDSAEMARLTAFVDAFCTADAIPEQTAADLHVVLDEQFANIVMHAYRDGSEHFIVVRLARAGNRLQGEVEDDGIPFNPLEAPEPDTGVPLDDRRIGGLGIHIIRNLMEEVRYERRGDRNVLSVSRVLPPASI